ncbi:MAG: VWA domain-containing protein [Trueperaceae bacterium]
MSTPLTSLLPAGTGFAAPWILLGTIAVVAMVVSLPRRRGWALRALALTAMVVALAQPWRSVPGGHAALLVDVSDSVGDTALRQARMLDVDQTQAREVYLVGAESTRVTNLSAAPPGFVDTGATDLARALQVAAAGGASRILLVSDGIAPRETVLASLPEVPVDVVPVASVPDVRVVDLLVPDHASPGQAVEAVAVIESDIATTVTVRPAAGDTILEPIERDLSEGRTAVPFRFVVGSAATVPVSVALDVPYEQHLGNDRAQANVTVRSRPPVLVIGDPAAAALLRVQEIDVVEGTAADLVAPIGYSAVVVRGSSVQFTPGQLEMMRSYVESGGGLLMTGGPESFGFGAWYRTAVEEVLPVTTDLRTEVTLPLVALVMVIDRSQSMSTGSPSKIELAKEGAVQVVELAYQDDLLGLIAFSDESSTRWVFELRQATERGKREMLQGILALDTGGGTVLGPAYERALAALASTEAAVKHVIVLSDGKLYDGQGPFAGTAGPDFDAMAMAALENGITTSTIAIGEAADFERLRAIATSGGGRYYEALDATTLPRIFTNEALTATRALLVDEPTAPKPRPNPLVTFPDSLPPVDAYVATTLKSDAQEMLAGREGEPLLATRRVGLGRTASLTTDLNGWAGAWGAWDGLPGALGTVVRWLQSNPLVYEATARRDGAELAVVVDAVRAGEYVNGERIEARYAGAVTVLDQVAPGRYVGRLPWRPANGGEVVLAAGGEVVARARIAGPDPEFADVDGEGLLRTIAERTGGVVFDPSQPYAPALASTRLPLWQWPAALALFLFLLELIWRRFAPARA